MDPIEYKLIEFDQGSILMHNRGPLHLPCKTPKEKKKLYNKMFYAFNFMMPLQHNLPYTNLELQPKENVKL
jgi:hypothetical protein